MSFLKILPAFFATIIFMGCNSNAPDFSGQWEQIDNDQITKRILTITPQGDLYQIVDELKDTSTDEVSYDEKSTGKVDGHELLTGTNTLTNVLNIDPESQQLIMKTYDETTLKFIKIN